MVNIGHVIWMNAYAFFLPYRRCVASSLYAHSPSHQGVGNKFKILKWGHWLHAPSDHQHCVAQRQHYKHEISKAHIMIWSQQRKIYRSLRLCVRMDNWNLLKICDGSIPRDITQFYSACISNPDRDITQSLPQIWLCCLHFNYRLSTSDLHRQSDQFLTKEYLSRRCYIPTSTQSTPHHLPATLEAHPRPSKN